MAYFLFRSSGSSCPRFLELRSRTERAGFPHVRTIRVGQGSIELFASIDKTYPTILDLPNGEAVIAFGMLTYNGKYGQSALTDFHREYTTYKCNLRKLAGIFTVLLVKRDSLYIANDILGGSKLYWNSDRTVISNSFLAVTWLLQTPKLQPQGCFEYVFAGSCYGTKTLVQDVTSVPHDRAVAVRGGRVELLPRSASVTQRRWPLSAALDDVARYHIARLEGVLEPAARQYGDRIAVSFSGGYDSRLILATLLKLGVRPLLFTYGAAGEIDVQIAGMIAEKEALEFRHVDKSAMPPLTNEELVAALERDFVAFDGWKAGNGIFSTGADFIDRANRRAGDRLPINGSLGEIYRNFFYLADRPYSAEDIVSCFYSGYDPRAGGELFDDRLYRANLAAEIRATVGIPSGKLSRADVERVYPEFRGRYWTARDAQLNQRFGPMLFPYLEAAVISGTAGIPLRLKSLGVLQGRMIEIQCARLARYPSVYGHPLAAPQTWQQHVQSTIRNHRPMLLRRWSYSLQHRQLQIRPKFLHSSILARAIDVSFPYMRKLFAVDRLGENTMYNRMATLEYLAQRLNFGEPRTNGENTMPKFGIHSC